MAFFDTRGNSEYISELLLQNAKLKIENKKLKERVELLESNQPIGFDDLNIHPIQYRAVQAQGAEMVISRRLWAMENGITKAEILDGHIYDIYYDTHEKSERNAQLNLLHEMLNSDVGDLRRQANLKRISPY